MKKWPNKKSDLARVKFLGTFGEGLNFRDHSEGLGVGDHFGDGPFFGTIPNPLI